MTDQPTAAYPSVIDYETLSGVVVRITPLSIFTLAAVKEKAETLFPFPDPLPFEEEIPGAVPGVKRPASDNPLYIELCKPIEEQRSEWRIEAYLEVGCTYPQFDSREAMLAHFRPRLEQLRTFLPPITDEWRAVLEHCVFTGKKDKQTVVDLCLQNSATPLTMPEVVGALRIFRVEVQRAKT